MDYTVWTEKGKQDLVRKALLAAATDGLTQPHHFHITFRTAYPGVSIPGSLHDKYPEDMTVVLQDSFWNLTVSDDYFQVDLVFDRKKSTLRIPLNSITSFIDPGANFVLQLDWSVHTPKFWADNVVSLEDFRSARIK